MLILNILTLEGRRGSTDPSADGALYSLSLSLHPILCSNTCETPALGAGLIPEEQLPADCGGNGCLAQLCHLSFPFQGRVKASA